MRIDNNGNVGIGTSPSKKLHVYNTASADVALLESTQAFSTLAFKSSTNSSTVTVGIDGAGNAAFENKLSSGSMTFVTNLSERMRIDSNGKLLVNTNTHTLTDTEMVVSSEYNAAGTTTGGITLSARQGGGWRSSGIFANGTDLTFTTGDTGLNGAQSSSEKMRIDSSGNLLVGCTDVPSASVPGFAVRDLSNGWIHTSYDSTNTRTHHNFFNPNGSVGTIQTSGSSTLYNTSSDQRLKDNIVNAPSASNDIDAIQVRSFDWKADGSHQKYGMVAQELQSVAPEAVSAPEDPEEMMGLDYSKLVPMLVKEIQSLRARVQQLENN
jgi:hypothetical protein